MEDLSRSVSMLTMSSKLEHAAESFQKMTANRPLSTSDKESLKWAGEFLSVVDWSSSVGEGDGHAKGQLTVQATSVRPTFYACLIGIAPEVRAAGLKNETEVNGFLSRLYRNLEQPGSSGKGHLKLNDAEAKLGYQFLHSIAESILVQVDNNGLPRAVTGLIEDWNPTQNELAAVAIV